MSPTNAVGVYCFSYFSVDLTITLVVFSTHSRRTETTRRCTFSASVFVFCVYDFIIIIIRLGCLQSLAFTVRFEAILQTYSKH